VDSKITKLVKELAEDRNNDRVMALMQKQAESSNRLERLLAWFGPVVETAKTLERDSEIGRKLYVFIKKHVGLESDNFKVHLHCELSSRDRYYSADTNKYMYFASDDPGLVCIETCNSHGVANARVNMPVADACAHMIDRAADMIRRR